MRVIYACLFVIAFSITSFVQAQDIYLKITGPNGALINGEVMAVGYRDQVEGLSYAESLGGTCSSTGGIGGCQVNTGNFFFTLNLDKSLNPLRSAMFRGQPLQKVEVSFVKTVNAAPFLYYKISLEDVMVSSISDAGAAGGGVNTIQIEFNPKKLGWTYIPQTSGGSAGTPVRFGWDREMNQEWTGF